MGLVGWIQQEREEERDQIEKENERETGEERAATKMSLAAPACWRRYGHLVALAVPLGRRRQFWLPLAAGREKMRGEKESDRKRYGGKS